LSDWEEMIKRLHEQRMELNASVKQRQINRAAKLTEMAERSAPDGKLVVGMKVMHESHPIGLDPNNARNLRHLFVKMKEPSLRSI
jgi:hypothetical protein